MPEQNPKENLLMQSLKKGIIVGIAVLVVLLAVMLYVNPVLGLTQFDVNTSVVFAFEAALLSLIFGALVNWLLNK